MWFESELFFGFRSLDEEICGSGFSGSKGYKFLTPETETNFRFGFSVPEKSFSAFLESTCLGPIHRVPTGTATLTSKNATLTGKITRKRVEWGFRYAESEYVVSLVQHHGAETRSPPTSKTRTEFLFAAGSGPGTQCILEFLSSICVSGSKLGSSGTYIQI